MIVIRRNQNNIVLNPFEYVTNKKGKVLTFNSKDQAIEFMSERLPDVENETILKEKYGIYLHEIDKEQYSEVNQDIISNDNV